MLVINPKSYLSSIKPIDRVYLHLSELEGAGADQVSFFYRTQKGIGRLCGIQQSHVSRIVKRMKIKGHVIHSKEYITISPPGVFMTFKVTYSLTDSGKMVAEDILNAICNKRVLYIDKKNHFKKKVMTIGELKNSLETKLGRHFTLTILLDYITKNRMFDYRKAVEEYNKKKRRELIDSLEEYPWEKEIR